MEKLGKSGHTDLCFSFILVVEMSSTANSWHCVCNGMLLGMVGAGI